MQDFTLRCLDKCVQDLVGPQACELFLFNPVGSNYPGR